MNNIIKLISRIEKIAEEPVYIEDSILEFKEKLEYLINRKIKNKDFKNWMELNKTNLDYIFPDILEQDAENLPHDLYIKLSDYYDLINIADYTFLKEKLSDDEYKYSEEFLLKSHANIPDIWVYSNIKSVPKSLDVKYNLPPDMAHNYYIIEALNTFSDKIIKYKTQNIKNENIGKNIKDFF